MTRSGSAVLILGFPAFLLLLVVACFAYPPGEQIFIPDRDLNLYSYPCLTDAPECVLMERIPAGTLFNRYGPYVAHDSMIWAAVDEDLSAWVPVARNGICPVQAFGLGVDDIEVTGIAIDPPIFAPPVIYPPDPAAPLSGA